jgi:hypothetical protein
VGFQERTWASTAGVRLKEELKSRMMLILLVLLVFQIGTIYLFALTLPIEVNMSRVKLFEKMRGLK